jgi:hypothetical protein
MSSKEFATAVALPVVLGLLPYFLENRGVPMPPWAINLGGFVTIAALCYGLFFPISWVFGNFIIGNMPMPSAISIALLCILGTIAAAWWVKGSFIDTPFDYHNWQFNKNETINRRSYFSEMVEVDGKTFDHCEFTNVKFLYHGIANITFLDPIFTGNIYLQTDNQAAKGFVILESYFRTQVKGIDTFVVLPSKTGHLS